MIELGVAYSYFCNRYKQNSHDYIFPFALYPVQKNYALSGTPLVNILVGDICDRDDIHNFLNSLSLNGAKNSKLNAFINDIDKIFLQQQNILECAKINTFFDDSIDFKHREDITYAGVTNNVIVVNYNMNPYEQSDVKYPNFISLVLGYVDKLDIGRYLKFNLESEFKCIITSFTNSLKRIFVEFKYSDNNRVLETFEFPIVYGENKLSIPLKNMKSRALENISEICFVIHPDDVVESEGMYKIEKIEIE